MCKFITCLLSFKVILNLADLFQLRKDGLLSNKLIVLHLFLFLISWQIYTNICICLTDVFTACFVNTAVVIANQLNLVSGDLALTLL